MYMYHVAYAYKVRLVCSQEGGVIENKRKTHNEEKWSETSIHQRENKWIGLHKYNFCKIANISTKNMGAE